MANDKLNKEFVSRMMDDAAWKKLSKDFHGQNSCLRSI